VVDPPAIGPDTLEALFDELFPLCRSITGPGLRRSLEILRRHVPFELEHVASGTRVFDWTVPDEWRIHEARLWAPDGKKLADLEDSTLAVVNYSGPVDRELSLDELAPHLHSLPALPDAVPYVTSYYQRSWGFCLPHRVRAALPQGIYRALIRAEHVGGSHGGRLDYGHCTLPGESPREILLSSYLCHPSLANNELSGPLVLASLYDRLRRWKRRRYTYRFVIHPETIGSLCYLWRHGDELRARLAAGLVLTCLGGERDSLSYKRSRSGSSLFDRAIPVLDEQEGLGFRLRDFVPTSGSDERQYCSPGFDLGVGQIARDVYGEYAGYHNSLDDKAFMRIDRLWDSAERIERLLLLTETSGCFLNLSPHGEPQLGKRGLYPNLNSAQTWNDSTDWLRDGRALRDRMLYVLSYSDGKTDMIEIARRAGCPVTALAPAIERLERAELLTLANPPNGART
jgi:aminopeptidase-like protein